MSDDLSEFRRFLIRPMRAAMITLAIFVAGFVLWATTAPLSSSIQLSGHIASSEQSITLQHRYGGRVAQVLVAQHDWVEQGDILMRLDVALVDEMAAKLDAQISALDDEQALIRALLDGHDPAAMEGSSALIQEARNTQKTRSNLLADIALMQSHLSAAHEKIALATAQLSLIEQRLERLNALQADGLVPLPEMERGQEQHLGAQARLSGETSRLIALKGELAKLQAEADMVLPIWRHGLMARHEANAERLAVLAGEYLSHQDRLAHAEIIAPVSGFVSELYIPVADMVLQVGGAVALIAKPLEEPRISLAIPPHLVDQVEDGMSGLVQFSSLSQRNLPKIYVELDAIAKRALPTGQDASPSYSARARFKEDPRPVLSSALGRENVLSEDMPVTVLLETRETTLAAYLFAPFAASFATALQD